MANCCSSVSTPNRTKIIAVCLIILNTFVLAQDIATMHKIMEKIDFEAINETIILPIGVDGYKQISRVTVNGLDIGVNVALFYGAAREQLRPIAMWMGLNILFCAVFFLQIPVSIGYWIMGVKGWEFWFSAFHHVFLRLLFLRFVYGYCEDYFTSRRRSESSRSNGPRISTRMEGEPHEEIPVVHFT